MTNSDREAHWQTVYTTKAEDQVSWFQDSPDISVELIRSAGLASGSAIVDVGGGASRLVDKLLEQKFDVTVLDLSEAALSVAKFRLGQKAGMVRWIVSDVTSWTSPYQFDLWHDRAAFHFLTEETHRAAYIIRLTQAVRPGGQAIIGTFALDGPERCSGLPVMRYDAKGLADTLGEDFELVETRVDRHQTPWRSEQRFQFSRFVRRRAHPPPHAAVR
jgi:2-polyprenyl-3-methyl-5-hydroxy-6-metoxy-1,4-benzoquinol methylase